MCTVNYKENFVVMKFLFLAVAVTTTAGTDQWDQCGLPRYTFSEEVAYSDFKLDGSFEERIPTYASESDAYYSEVEQTQCQEDDFGESGFGSGRERVDGGTLPWQVSIMYRRRYECGGALLSSDKILTAAHCFDKYWSTDESDWSVKAGHIMTVKYIHGVHQVRLISEIQSHRNYDQSRSHLNDIAIVHVNEPFDYSTWVRPVCLPTPDFNTDSGRMIIAGTGEQLRSRFMTFTTIPLCSQTVCDNFYASSFQPETMICGGEWGRASCHGDSGGPLVARVNGQFTVIGVTSHGNRRDCMAAPSVYTRVAAYLDFIYASM